MEARRHCVLHNACNACRMRLRSIGLTLILLTPSWVGLVNCSSDDGPSCEEVSDQAWLAVQKALNEASHECAVDSDCTLLTDAAQCARGSLTGGTSMATTAVTNARQEVARANATYCAKHPECATAPLPLIPSGTWTSVCNTGFCESQLIPD